MEIGSAAAPEANGVRTIRGKEGIVVFGPYLTLPPGKYSLTVFIEQEISTEEFTENEYDIRIEAVYERIIMAYILLSSHNRRQGLHVMSFIVPEFSMECLDDARFEFRVWSRGLREFYIRSLNLEVLAHSNDKIELDWLPLMNIGGAGHRVSGDSAEAAASLTSRGHVVYGPYIRMLPGRYRLVVECAILRCIGPKISINVEVVIAQNENLVTRTYELIQGAHTLELEFMIDREIFSRKEGGEIEFRVYKETGAELIIASIQTIYDNKARDCFENPNIWNDRGNGGMPTERVQQTAAIETAKERSGYRWSLWRFLRNRGDHRLQN
jgi:hypothetical protein